MPKRVLVVDDSAVIRQVEESVLGKAGYEVVSANGGKEALLKMQATSFNLVLTDLNMPDLDGVSLIKQVRAGANHRLTPIVMITTESKDSKKQEGKSAGATAWMVKPFTPEQLLAVVKRIIG
jgi:two-component system, chemotaxis family, chemotaxis protein CheY